MFLRLSLPALAVCICATLVGADDGSDACFGESRASARTDCLVERLEGPAEDRLYQIEGWLTRDAQTALGVIDRLDKRLAKEWSAAPQLRARLLDLRATALERLGRRAEAAETFSSAIAVDDGTLRLRWYDSAGGTAWIAP